MNKPTSILIPISITEKVISRVFDATGRLEKTFPENQLLRGKKEINWDKKDENGNPVSPGIYLVKLTAGNYSETKKIPVFK
jgi:flagellar hook assembly protein FlgD